MLRRVIVRLPNWLGDTIMAVPALRALRRGLPEATVLLAGPWARLLADQNLGDVLVTYPRAWSGRVGVVDAVRDFRGDTVLLLPNSFEAALTALYWGARRRIGFRVHGRGILLSHGVPLPLPRRHQIEEYLLLAEQLGVSVVETEPRLSVPAIDSAVRQEARRLLAAAGVEIGGSWIGVHVGADFGAAKLWTRERTVEFCRLVRSSGRTAVVLGSPRELALATMVAEESGAVCLAGKDRPELLPALVAEMTGLVCGDTGVAHLAAALGTPVVTLFGPTDPRLTAPRGPAAVIRHAVPCAPCYYRTCPIEHPCMQGIEGMRVYEALETLLPRLQ